MPINFYIKNNKVEVSENTKYLKYNIIVEGSR
jgi:preprotein translocase subunit SecB